MGIELLFLLIMLLFEFVLDNYKSMLIFMAEASSYAALVLVDILILLKYKFYEGDEETRLLIETVLESVVYFMLSMVVLVVVLDYLPWDCFKETTKERMKRKSKIKNQLQRLRTHETEENEEEHKNNLNQLM